MVDTLVEGNVARFANHRCGNYNMISQPVYRNSHSVNFFYNALFTREEVTPRKICYLVFNIIFENFQSGPLHGTMDTMMTA